MNLHRPIAPESSEHALPESDTLFRALFDSAPVGIFLNDTRGQCTYVNGRCSEIMGLTSRQASGEGWFTAIAPEDQPWVIGQWTEALRSNQEFSGEYRFRRPDRSVVWVQCNSTTHRSADGEVLGFIGTLIDITERKTAEDALRESQSMYADLYENAPDMMASIDPATGKVVRCNQTLARVLGRPKSEIVGTPATSILSEQSTEGAENDAGRRFASTDTLTGGQMQLRCADGTTRDVLLNSTAERNTEGVILYTRSVLRDVSAENETKQRLAESEARLQAIFDSEPECVKLVAADGSIMDMNAAGLAMVEADSLDQIAGKPVYGMICPEHRSAYRSMHHRVMQGENVQLEFEIVGLAGTHRWMESHATPMRDVNGMVVAQLAITRDITARREAERFLELENSLLSAVAHGLPLQSALDRVIRFIEEQANDVLATVMILDADGVHLHHGASSAFSRTMIETINGLEIGERTLNCGVAAFRARPVLTEDLEADPYWRPYLGCTQPLGVRACWSKPILDPRGRVLGTFAIYRKTTGAPTAQHRKLMDVATSLTSMLLASHRNEQRLTESERLFRTIFEQAAVGVALVNTVTGEFIRVNDRYCEILGLTQDELVGHTWMERTHPDDLELNQRKSEVLLSGETREFAIEKRLRHHDGSYVWVEVSISGMWTGDEPKTTNIAIVKDITVQKHAEEQLRLTQFSIDSASTPVFWIRPDARFIYVNDASVRRFGFSREELLTMTVHDIDPDYDAEAWPAYWQRLQETRSLTFESQIQCKDGALVPVEITTNLQEFEEQEFIFAFVSDLSARKAAEQERRQHLEMLAHVARLSTMGELIGGIAHEVRQPLYAIANFATAGTISLQQLDPEKAPSPEWLAELESCCHGIHQSSHRANEIIRRLREFARRGDHKRDALGVHEFIRDSIDLVAFKARQCRVSVKTEFAHRLPQIVGDRIQCEQVLVNLLHNAYEALDEVETPRKVVIRTRHVGDNVQLQVEDNGPGVREEHLGNLFEAFVTTKPNGMGMGLAISRTIVEDHGGRLWVETDRAHGAAFNVTFPVESEN